VTTYYTSAGEPVAALGPGERLVDWRQSVGMDRSARGMQQAKATAGEAVVAMLGGTWTPEVHAALAGGSGPSGGYTLDRTVSAQIIDLARDESVVFRAGARTVPMPTSELVLAGIASDPTVTWRGENELIPLSDVAFNAIRLRARSFACIIPVSRELVADSPNAASEINRLLAVAAAQEIDRVALMGDGDGEEPVGVLNYDGITENVIGGAVDWDDVLDSVAAIEGRNGSPNAMIYSPAVKRTLAGLKINSEANHYAPAPMALDGLERYVTNKIGDATAVVGDFSKLIVGVREGVTIEASENASASTGEGYQRHQVLIKMFWRGDVAITHPSFFEKLTGIS
jgi:HK97 family phage major capsid protein